jgi:hypothetical protein
MKEHNTQKLFWKQWPYKAIVEIRPSPTSKFTGWRISKTNTDRQQDFELVERWCKARFPNAGIRKETHLSLFLSSETELDELLDHFGHRVLEVWKPKNALAKDMLLAHEYDVVRAKPWYNKYAIRARIAYNSEFRTKYLQTFREAVISLGDENWHAAGQLLDIIKQSKAERYGWGQPLYLYLASAEDAAMLRLQCGDIIERFERIRKPE